MTFFRSFAFAVLYAALPQQSTAQTGPVTWELNEKRSEYRCKYNCTVERQAYKDLYDAALKRVADMAKPELDAISVWLSGLGFHRGYYPSNPSPFYTRPDFDGHVARAPGEAPDTNTVAAYSAQLGMELKYGAFIHRMATITALSQADLDSMVVTLAHEVYHAIQAGYHGKPKTDKKVWFVESTAEAVGAAWAEKRGLPGNLTEGDYHQPLHSPDFKYARGKFFYNLGQDLDSKDTIQYLTELEPTAPPRSDDGLKWIDDFITKKRAPLHEYYPTYIAKYGHRAKDFSIEAFDDHNAERWEPLTQVTADQTIVKDRKKRRIAEIAAIYTEVGAEFLGNWSGLPEEETIFVNAIKISDAKVPDAAHLVVGKEVIEAGKRHVKAFMATSGRMKHPEIVRVVNIAQELRAVKPQEVEIELSTQALRIPLPVCLKPGETYQLKPKSEDLSEEELKEVLGDKKLWFTAGDLSDGFVYTAPPVAKAVIGGLDVSGLDGKTTTVKLGSIVISPKGCMIQMRAGPAEMTYTFDGEYTEFKDPGTGTAMYMSRGDMAGYENGWLRLPAQAKAMIIGNIEQNMAREIGGVDWLVRDRFDFHISQMPKSMSLRFSWPFLSVGAKGPNGNAVKEKKADCPAWSGTKKCSQTVVSIEGNAVPVTFNGAGMPLIVKFFDGNTFEFEYGNFNIRRPSGW